MDEIGLYVAEIRLKSGSKETLDLENLPQNLDFWLQAKDNGGETPNGEIPFTSENVKVKVKLIDVNDHVPQFAKKDLKVDVKENLEIGSEIIRIPVIDQDSDLKNLKFSPRKSSKRKLIISDFYE